MRWIAPARALVAALWAGSLCTIGYIVAPTAFAKLFDNVLAGSLAGMFFRVEGWVSLGLGTLFIVLAAPVEAKPRKWLWALAAAILLCTAVIQFVLHPMIAELRSAGGILGVLTGETRERFRLLHGVSSALWMLQTVLALALVVKNR